MLGAVGGDGRDELDAGADGTLGVVLLRDRGAPDRHDGVADELLDDAPVAGDDGPGELEVAGEELPYLLGVAPLREGREADEVAEQHRDVAELGAARLRPPEAARSPATGRHRRAVPPWDEPRAAVAATCGAPHSPQNFVPARSTVAQFEQICPRALPHSSQNLVPARFSVPQLVQTIHWLLWQAAPVPDKRYLPAEPLVSCGPAR